VYGFVGQPFLKQLYIFNEMQPETKENRIGLASFSQNTKENPTSLLYHFFYYSAYKLLPMFYYNTSLELPYNDYFEYFGPDFKLHISPSNMANQNTTDYLEKIK